MIRSRIREVVRWALLRIVGPELELKKFDITKDSRGRRHMIPRPLSLKVFTRVVEQLSIDDAENGSVLQTIKEHTRFTAQHIKNVMWRVRTEITESEWKSWSTVPESPPPCVLSKEISEDELQKLFGYNDLAALNAENVQPEQNEPQSDFESVRQSCITAAIRELRQQKTSSKSDHDDSEGIQERAEDSNTLKPNGRIRAFRLFNQEREEAARDRKVFFQSMRKVTMHSRLSGLDPKRKDIELARAAMIRWVKRWDIQTPPGQDSKYGMYHGTWRNIKASLARFIAKVAQSLRHLCQATVDQTKTMYFLCFRLYDNACCRSFDERTTFVKNATAQLWKKKLLHLYFYQCPAAWDTVSLRDIIANICKPKMFNFRADLQDIFRNAGFDDHLTDARTFDVWLYLYLPETKSVVEEKHKPELITASQVAKNVISTIFTDNPLLLSLESYRRVSPDLSNIDEHSEKVLAKLSQTLESKYPELVSKERGMRECYNNMLHEVQENILAEFLSASIQQCRSEMPDLWDETLKAGNTAEIFRGGATRYTFKTFLEGKVRARYPRYLASKDFTWLWGNKTSIKELLTLHLPVSNIPSPGLILQGNEIDMPFDFDDQAALPSDWSLRDIKYALSCRLRESPLPYATIMEGLKDKRLAELRTRKLKSIRKALEIVCYSQKVPVWKLGDDSNTAKLWTEELDDSLATLIVGGYWIRKLRRKHFREFSFDVLRSRIADLKHRRPELQKHKECVEEVFNIRDQQTLLRARVMNKSYDSIVEDHFPRYAPRTASGIVQNLEKEFPGKSYQQILESLIEKHGDFGFSTIGDTTEEPPVAEVARSDHESPWTLADSRTLMKAVTEEYQMSMIVARYFPKHSASALKNRLVNLQQGYPGKGNSEIFKILSEEHLDPIDADVQGPKQGSDTQENVENRRLKKQWTMKEKQIILKGVINGKNRKSIVEAHVPHRTEASCLSCLRHIELQFPGTKLTQILKILIKEHGDLSPEITCNPSDSAKPQAPAQKKIESSRSAQRWTIKEDQILLKGTINGESYDSTAKIYFPNRTNHACKTRFRRIRSHFSGLELTEILRILIEEHGDLSPEVPLDGNDSAITMKKPGTSSRPNPFTIKEKQIFLKGVLNGEKKTSIAENHFSYRTHSACLSGFARIMRAFPGLQVTQILKIMIEENGDCCPEITLDENSRAEPRPTGTSGKKRKAHLEDDHKGDDGIQVKSAPSRKRAKRSVPSRKAKYNLRGNAVKHVVGDDDKDEDYGSDGDEEYDWDEEKGGGEYGSGEEGREEDEDDESEDKGKDGDGKW